jgi:hypothetical protein
MIKKRNTRLNALLADMDECFLPNEKRKIFSIGFYNAKGEYIYLQKAIKYNVNQKDRDYKGVQRVDENGNSMEHPYPVWIHSIRNYRSLTFIFEYGQQQD